MYVPSFGELYGTSDTTPLCTVAEPLSNLSKSDNGYQMLTEGINGTGTISFGVIYEIPIPSSKTIWKLIVEGFATSVEPYFLFNYSTDNQTWSTVKTINGDDLKIVGGAPEDTYISNLNLDTATRVYIQITHNMSAFEWYQDTLYLDRLYLLVGDASSRCDLEIYYSFPIGSPAIAQEWNFTIECNGTTDGPTYGNERYNFDYSTTWGGPWTNMFYIDGGAPKAKYNYTKWDLSSTSWVYIRITDNEPTQVEPQDWLYIDMMRLNITYISTKFSNPKIKPPQQGSDNSVLTVKPAISVLPSTYTITISGTSRIYTVTTTCTFSVTYPFAISGTPASQKIYCGQKASYILNITSINGFQDNVKLALTEGMPAGCTYTFQPETFLLTKNGFVNAYLNITTYTTTLGAEYTITITATNQTGTQRTTRTTSVILAVADVNISVNYGWLNNPYLTQLSGKSEIVDPVLGDRYLEPYGDETNPERRFTININITAKPTCEIACWQVFLKWDPSVISFLTYQWGGYIPKNPEPMHFMYLDHGGVLGTAFIAELVGIEGEGGLGAPGRGNGTLINITFSIIDLGQCKIELIDEGIFDTEVLNYSGNYFHFSKRTVPFQMFQTRLRTR